MSTASLESPAGVVPADMVVLNVTAKFTDIGIVRKKNAFIAKQVPELKNGVDLTQTANKQKFAKAIFGITQVMEGTQFYALFAMILSLHRQNKMTGIGQMFQYTLRDESNHIALGRYLLTQPIHENPISGHRDFGRSCWSSWVKRSIWRKNWCAIVYLRMVWV